jgi:hypothetical protein
MKGPMAETENEGQESTPVEKAKQYLSKEMAILLGFLSVMGPVATAYLSFRQSKIEAAAERAHKESAAGYETVANPLNQIMAVVIQQAGDIERLKSDVAGLKAMQLMPPPPPAGTHQLAPLHLVSPHPIGLGALWTIGRGAGAGAGAPAPAAAEKQTTEALIEEKPMLRPLNRQLPKTLDDAAKLAD